MVAEEFMPADDETYVEYVYKWKQDTQDADRSSHRDRGGSKR